MRPGAGKSVELARLQAATGAHRVVGEPIKAWGKIQGFWVCAYSDQASGGGNAPNRQICQGRGDSYAAAVDDAIAKSSKL